MPFFAKCMGFKRKSKKKKIDIHKCVNWVIDKEEEITGQDIQKSKVDAARRFYSEQSTQYCTDSKSVKNQETIVNCDDDAEIKSILYGIIDQIEAEVNESPNEINSLTLNRTMNSTKISADSGICDKSKLLEHPIKDTEEKKIILENQINSECIGDEAAIKSILSNIIDQIETEENCSQVALHYLTTLQKENSVQTSSTSVHYDKSQYEEIPPKGFGQKKKNVEAQKLLLVGVDDADVKTIINEITDKIESQGEMQDLTHLKANTDYKINRLLKYVEKREAYPNLQNVTNFRPTSSNLLKTIPDINLLLVKEMILNILLAAKERALVQEAKHKIDSSKYFSGHCSNEDTPNLNPSSNETTSIIKTPSEINKITMVKQKILDILLLASKESAPIHELEDKFGSPHSISGNYSYKYASDLNLLSPLPNKTSSFMTRTLSSNCDIDMIKQKISEIVLAAREKAHKIKDRNISPHFISLNNSDKSVSNSNKLCPLLIETPLIMKSVSYEKLSDKTVVSRPNSTLDSSLQPESDYTFFTDEVLLNEVSNASFENCSGETVVSSTDSTIDSSLQPKSEDEDYIKEKPFNEISKASSEKFSEKTVDIQSKTWENIDFNQTKYEFNEVKDNWPEFEAYKSAISVQNNRSAKEETGFVEYELGTEDDSTMHSEKMNLKDTGIVDLYKINYCTDTKVERNETTSIDDSKITLNFAERLLINGISSVGGMNNNIAKPSQELQHINSFGEKDIYLKPLNFKNVTGYTEFNFDVSLFLKSKLSTFNLLFSDPLPGLNQIALSNKKCSEPTETKITCVLVSNEENQCLTEDTHTQSYLGIDNKTPTQIVRVGDWQPKKDTDKQIENSSKNIKHSSVQDYHDSKSLNSSLLEAPRSKNIGNKCEYSIEDNARTFSVNDATTQFCAEEENVFKLKQKKGHNVVKPEKKLDNDFQEILDQSIFNVNVIETEYGLLKMKFEMETCTKFSSDSSENSDAPKGKPMTESQGKKDYSNNDKDLVAATSLVDKGTLEKPDKKYRALIGSNNESLYKTEIDRREFQSQESIFRNYFFKEYSKQDKTPYSDNKYSIETCFGNHRFSETEDCAENETDITNSHINDFIFDTEKFTENLKAKKEDFNLFATDTDGIWTLHDETEKNVSDEKMKETNITSQTVNTPVRYDKIAKLETECNSDFEKSNYQGIRHSEIHNFKNDTPIKLENVSDDTFFDADGFFRKNVFENRHKYKSLSKYSISSLSSSSISSKISEVGDTNMLFPSVTKSESFNISTFGDDKMVQEVEQKEMRCQRAKNNNKVHKTIVNIKNNKSPKPYHVKINIASSQPDNLPKKDEKVFELKQPPSSETFQLQKLHAIGKMQTTMRLIPIKKVDNFEFSVSRLDAESFCLSKLKTLPSIPNKDNFQIEVNAGDVNFFETQDRQLDMVQMNASEHNKKQLETPKNKTLQENNMKAIVSDSNIYSETSVIMTPVRKRILDVSRSIRSPKYTIGCEASRKNSLTYRSKNLLQNMRNKELQKPKVYLVKNGPDSYRLKRGYKVQEGIENYTGPYLKLQKNKELNNNGRQPTDQSYVNHVLSPPNLIGKFDEKFQRYAIPDRTTDELISFKRSTEWLKDAGIVGHELTAEEATDAFKCVGKVTLNKEEYRMFLKKLARLKKLSYHNVYKRLCEASKRCTD